MRKSKGGIVIYARINYEIQLIQKKIHKLKKQIEKLPPGHLISSRTEKRYKWYQSDGITKTYIPKEKRELAEKLALKKYLESKLKRLEEENNALNCYLNYYQKHIENTMNSEELLEKDSKYFKLLSPYIKNKSEKIRKWLEKDFEKNDKYVEGLACRTTVGTYVRSKSEVIIDTLLRKYDIPFKYECVLKLGKFKYYPDFTIMHPITGEIYYWEHFGRMDDEKYVDKMCRKLKMYAKNGIIPSVNLIVTYETGDEQLNPELVEELIRFYFGEKIGQELILTY